MKNLFICHRPYHILRSADIINKLYSNEGIQNILICYNVININTNNYNSQQSISVLDKCFTKRINLTRNDDISIWNILKFRQYYKKKVDSYKEIVSQYSDFDNIYFFSDMEKPIEILVGMLKEKKKNGANIIIVDEGYAAYYNARPFWKTIVKSIVVWGGHFKYLNHSANYGHSNLYTAALATFPKLCVFRNVPITKMLPLDTNFLSDILCSYNIPVNLHNRYIIYLSTVIDIEYGVLPETEFNVLKKMIQIAEKYGCQFYIKPHPIQDPNYYCLHKEISNHVLVSPLPAEMFFSENATIVSVGSSSLINAKMQGIRAMDLSKLFRIDTGLPSFDIISPKDFEEYEQLVKG